MDAEGGQRGPRWPGSASLSRTYDTQQLERLLARTERAIADLEAQNEDGDAGGAEGAGTLSGGLLITAADVTQDPTDQAQLLPMIEAAAQSGGTAAGLTLADAGYFSAANLAACAARATPVAIPESAPVQPRTPTTTAASPTTPAATATSVPEGRWLRFQRLKHRRKRASVRVYAAARRGLPGVSRLRPLYDQHAGVMGMESV